MALVHWPERKYLAPCREPVDFKRNLIALFLQSKYRAITRGQLCSPLFCNLVSNKRLQMPQAKGFRYSAQWWSYILCFFHVMLVLFTLRVSYSNFVFFSTLMGQKGINNLNFIFFFLFLFLFSFRPTFQWLVLQLQHLFFTEQKQNQENTRKSFFSNERNEEKNTTKTRGKRWAFHRNS